MAIRRYLQIDDNLVTKQLFSLDRFELHSFRRRAAISLSQPLFTAEGPSERRMESQQRDRVSMNAEGRGLIR